MAVEVIGNLKLEIVINPLKDEGMYCYIKQRRFDLDDYILVITFIRIIISR